MLKGLFLSLEVTKTSAATDYDATTAAKYAFMLCKCCLVVVYSFGSKCIHQDSIHSCHMNAQ